MKPRKTSKIRRSPRALRTVLAYDLGGTKVAIGVVSEKGKILEEKRLPVPFEKGKDAVIEFLCKEGRDFLRRYPLIKNVGVASAGPLDPRKGILLDPTNFSSAQGNWGKVPLVKLLSKGLKRKVFLENDAAAAILAEKWIGAAKSVKNSMILTLGTGLGTGIIVNDQLVRCAHDLHPEGGHIILNWQDQTAPCGCGNLGCAEAYLSGRNFARRARTRFANPDLTAKDITELARKRDPRAVAAFREYSEILAVAITSFVVLYAPEKILFTGSFADAFELFAPETRTHLERLLARRRDGIDLMPRLEVSKLENEAGLLGGAYVALFEKESLRR
ncbi:MAG: ROK family protein [Bdellovibrionales bacterium]|nr:ROK family protein [Bdellovibrionales bacterium]